jgi:hypothetical protein
MKASLLLALRDGYFMSGIEWFVLESWRVRELESWRVGELESWRVGELGSWRVGDMEKEERI